MDLYETAGKIEGITCIVQTISPPQTGVGSLLVMCYMGEQCHRGRAHKYHDLSTMGPLSGREV